MKYKHHIPAPSEKKTKCETNKVNGLHDYKKVENFGFYKMTIYPKKKTKMDPMPSM